MTVVVFGIDALDPSLVNADAHSNLTLNAYRSIETIDSVAGEPSTHELWPTIITGLTPPEHGLTLNDGVAWETPWLRVASDVADSVLPDSFQTRLGAWLLNNTEADAFRIPATYYQNNGLSTVFDGHKSAAIGVPNYVVDPDNEDREHQLRRSLGELFERDPSAVGGHVSADPLIFYEQCLEMFMLRIARTRRALRGGQYELVFGYTSGLDLVGHIAYDNSELQEQAYTEADTFVGELRDDLAEDDELVLVSDHGLQNGVHTHKAMIAGTNPETIEHIKSIIDVRTAVETALTNGSHEPTPRETGARANEADSTQVREHLEDLGYI
jgi:predicted AlkP superfamily pyrophosphatase or phosphodiesterase